MSDERLLLSSARAGVLVPPRRSHPLRVVAIVLGLFAVLVGALDLASRASHLRLDERMSLLAFAPAASLGDPAVYSRLVQQTPQAAATSTQPLLPARLKVPSLGINAPVENVGKKADGTMGTPSGFGSVGWYALGAKPGGPGNAVLAGHVNNALTTAGVFEHLSQISPGAIITVEDKNGASISYAVSSVEEYPASSAPAEAIFTTQGPSQLILITCDGEWDAAAHQFDKRLVVVARPVAL